MALYLGGSNKLKLVTNNMVYRFNLLPKAPISNVIRLLSSDGYILKDLNGIYLTVKESE